ncbi:MAG: Inositol 2-dehydrogenase/D-chiro-inositol 3-dehydrogenase [Fimbriimonadaceae bacterium]|nr:Inositol 2-dehydrogenase/D-chiro-inositol 3-dehydrogenase [Fimbriimonadaceae bacterium]
MVSSVAAGAVAAAPRAFGVHQGQATLKIGLIGCGGRGTGAVTDAVASAKGIELWAMGDVFKDRLDGSRKHLSENLKGAYKVTNDRAFVGFDAYKKVIDSGVDVVILTSPPGFRPIHLRAAVEAKKHVFMEKPVAVDAPGILSVFESHDLAEKAGLNIVAGTQRRHDVAYRQVMDQIRAGEIGDVVACYAYWNQGGLWMNPRESNWSDVEWQLRNWLYFAYLSGDHIVEQHVHNIDVCNWAMNAHPVKAISLAGRQVRTDPAYGHIFDHFATEYEYANGVKMLSMCRQIDGTAARVSEHIVGTKGVTNGNTSIKGQKNWRFDGDRPNPYVLEHTHLYDAIRSGKRINEARQVAESTMTAILGRMAAYSGQEITWDQALKSEEVLMPPTLAFGEMAVQAIAVPGKTVIK